MAVNGVKYELNRLNMAKRCCSDDANLCEITEITLENEEENKAINKILEANRWNTMIRRQIEKTSALGTEAVYISIENANVTQDGEVHGGNVKLNYVSATQYVPLTVVNDEVTEAAFCSKEMKDSEYKYTLVIFTRDDNGIYNADSYVLNENGMEIDSSSITLGDIKPFAVYRTAEVNNLKQMGEGYGLPKIWNSISAFKGIDLAYNILFSDLDKGEKIILVNDLLCKYDSSHNITQSIENKKLFVLTGEKLPEQENMIHEYNPEIRIKDVRDTFEFLLSLLSLNFGYGSKKYTFENSQIQTATEYIGSKQDEMQALNRQRYQTSEYIKTIVKAIEWFENRFNNAEYDLNQEIKIDYDDSLIIDKETILERKRNDAVTFDIPQLTIWYLMDAYNLTEEEATRIYREKDTPEDETDEDE